MKALFFAFIFCLLFQFSARAEEQEIPKEEKAPKDPISAIITAPFEMIGALFNPGNYEYDPDDPYPWGYYGRYGDGFFYYGYDPYWDWGPYYHFNYYRRYHHHHHHHRRHSRDPC